MRSKPPTLTPDLRALCGRLASERTKRTAWALAAQLRAEMVSRLLAGEPAEVLIDDLNAQIQQAAVQTRCAHLDSGRPLNQFVFSGLPRC